MISEPTYNIVTPLNIVQILTNHFEPFLKEYRELLENIKVASIRIQTKNLSRTELIEVFECLKNINTRQVPILIENNLELAGKLKVDGVHLTAGQKLVKEARETLGKDKIIGAFCGSSKHSGLVAAEHGANYVAFQAENNTTEGDKSNRELFQWWSEFIEIPVMAECSSSNQIAKELWGYCDFFSLGINTWEPGVTLASLVNLKNSRVIKP